MWYLFVMWLLCDYLGIPEIVDDNNDYSDNTKKARNRSDKKLH